MFKISFQWQTTSSRASFFNVTEYAVQFINLFHLHHAAYTFNDETQTSPYPSRATLSGWLRSLQYTAVTITSCSGFRHFVEIITKAVQAVAPTYLQSDRLQFTVSFFKEVIGARQAAPRRLTTAAKYKLFVADVEGLVALPMRVEVLSLMYTDDHRSNSEGILLPSFNVWSPNGVRIYAISNTVASGMRITSLSPMSAPQCSDFVLSQCSPKKMNSR